MENINATKAEIPHPVSFRQEAINLVDLHIMGDSSVIVSCVAVYA